MNPYAILAIVVAFGIVLAGAGVQTYRLQGAQNTIALHEQADEQRRENEAHRQRANTANAGRTNEEVRAARERAGRVRVEFPARPSGETPVARGGDEATVCFERKLFDRALAELGQSLSGVARQGEEVAAAYRGCVTYIENLE